MQPGDLPPSDAALGWVTYLPPGLDTGKDYIFIRKEAPAATDPWHAAWITPSGEVRDVWRSLELSDLTERAALKRIEQVVFEDPQTGTTYLC